MRLDCLGRLPDGRMVLDFEATAPGVDLGAYGRGKKQSRRKKTAAYAIPIDTTAVIDQYLRLVSEYRAWPVLGQGEPRFLFPLLTPARDAFKNKPLTASHVRKRLQQHLTAMGEWEGETSHSLKRGCLMLSSLSDAELAQCTSLTVPTIRLYRDVRR